MVQQKTRGRCDFEMMRYVMVLPTVLYFSNCEFSCLKFMLMKASEIRGVVI